MRGLAWLQAQSPTVKQTLSASVLGLLGFAALAAWYAFGLNQTSGPTASLAQPSSGNATEQLITERTNQRIQQDQQTNDLLAGTSSTTEPLDGLLHLGSRYRAHGVTVILDRIEFYPSAVRAYLTVMNESETEVTLDLPPSTFEQSLPGGSNLTLLANDDSETLSLTPQSTQQVQLNFPPANGRASFRILVGGFSANTDTWQARFSIDPATIIGS